MRSTIFNQKLNSGDDMDHQREAKIGAPLACGEGLGLSTKLLDWELDPHVCFACMGLQGGLTKACTFFDTLVKILAHQQKFVSQLCLSFHIYIVLA
jgi:hypothetical protein